VKLDMATADDLKQLRQNPSKHMTLISFWATWCGSCIDEFADFQETFQMYRVRDFDLITVSANMPDEKEGVMRMLEKKHATSRNLLFASNDTAALQAAFDPDWESAVPYTVLFAPDGKVLYKNLGSVDILELADRFHSIRTPGKAAVRAISRSNWCFPQQLSRCVAKGSALWRW
jgi:thiol-disulfide isomerase/thioredoxin